METPFLVRCVDEGNNPLPLTINKVYWAIDLHNTFYELHNDDTGSRGSYFEYRFKKLNFIDIWELKRNEKQIPG